MKTPSNLHNKTNFLSGNKHNKLDCKISKFFLDLYIMILRTEIVTIFVWVTTCPTNPGTKLCNFTNLTSMLFLAVVIYLFFF